MENLHFLYQIVLLSSLNLVAIFSLDCSVVLQSYSKSDSPQTGTLSLNGAVQTPDWGNRFTAGVVLFSLAPDCTVSQSVDLTFTDEVDFIDKITGFIQSQPLGSHIVGATLYEVLYDSIQTQNIFKALGVHMFGSFDGSSFELYSTAKSSLLYDSSNNHDGTLLFIAQKGSKHKAIYKSFEGGDGPSLTATVSLDYTCVPPMPAASLFADQTTSEVNRRYSQQTSTTFSNCAGAKMRGWQYIANIDNSAGPQTNLYLLNSVTGSAIVDTEISTSADSLSAKTFMCLANADQKLLSGDFRYGLYYDSTADGESVVQGLYPTFEGALTGQCGYEAAVTDLDILKALDTASIFTNGGADITRSHAIRPIFESDFVASCECTSDSDCQTPGGDGHMICESSQCVCEGHYTYDPESNSCQYSLNPLSISTITTSGLSEGTEGNVFDTDTNGDPDLSTSMALSPTSNPWVVIDLGSETVVNSVEIAVPQVQAGFMELTCCGTDTFLYTVDHPDLVNNVTCDVTTAGLECTQVQITGPYSWLFYDQLNYEGNSVLFENSPGTNVETHALSANPASFRRVDELGVLQSTADTSTCVNSDGSDNGVMGACDMGVYFESDLIRRKVDGMVLNPAGTSDGDALSFSTSTTAWKTQDVDNSGNSGIDPADFAAGAYLELQSENTLCVGLQSGTTDVLALRTTSTANCLVFKQSRTVPRLLVQESEQSDITLDGDGDCTNDITSYQATSYSYPACSTIEENSGSSTPYIVYNSQIELGFTASDSVKWADCAGSSTQRLIYKADNPSLHDFVVGVSNTFTGTFSANDFSTCATYSGTLKNGRETKVKCDSPQRGRYLSINIPSQDLNEVIYLSNVKVNGKKELPVGQACNIDDDCQQQGGGVHFVCTANTCQCDAGFEYQSSSEACVDVDECFLGTSTCEQDCTNTRGSYTCSCNQYCTLNADQSTCDCPSCAADNGGCVNGVCAESGTPGLVTCSCDIDGTTLDTDAQTCINIDECLDDTQNNCDEETTGLAQCSDLTPVANGDPKYECDCGDPTLIAYNEATSTCEILDSVKTNGATDNSLCSVNNGDCSETCNPGANPLLVTCSCTGSATLLPDGVTCVVCAPAVQSLCEGDSNNLGYCTDDPTDPTADICACQYSDLGISWNDTDCTTGADPDNLCSIENGQCEHTCLTGTLPNSQSPLLDYTCACTVGYQLMSDGLTPDHVCSGTAHGCSTTCDPGVNIHEFTCSCNSGFALGTDGKTCENINECEDAATCATNGTVIPTCQDTVGSFTCACGSGYTWDGSLCNNIDECADNKGGCEQNCQDLDGSFECSCGTGYTLDADLFGCTDVNECNTDNGGCGTNTNCVNLPGTSECDCLSSGYQFVANSFVECENIDECSTDNGGCNQDCTDSDGSFVCSCNSTGYALSGDGLTCVDINECEQGIDECEHECRNLIGSMECYCQVGYEVDPFNAKDCIDIQECERGSDNCAQICTNSIGSYACSCMAGYSLNTDKETCTAESACTGINCIRGQCAALDGTWMCICDQGYSLVSTGSNTCIDTNECLEDVCRANSQCVNTDGGFSCPCNVGFSATDLSSACEDIDECLNNPCGLREVCTNTVGSYACECASQFEVNLVGECTALTIAVQVQVVIAAPISPSLPSADMFAMDGAIPGTERNILLVQMCIMMNLRSGFLVICVVTNVRIGSLAVDFEVTFQDTEGKTASEVAVIPQTIYDSLNTTGDGQKVVQLGNETVPLNDTGRFFAITEFVTPDGRTFGGNDTDAVFSVDVEGSTSDGEGDGCSFFMAISYCMNGSSCVVNSAGFPECSCLEGFQGDQCSEFIATATTNDNLTGTEVILISVFVPIFVIGVGVLLFWIVYMALRRPMMPPRPNKYAYPAGQRPYQTPPRTPQQLRSQQAGRRWWDEYTTASTPETVESESRQERLSRWPAYRAYGIASRFPGTSSYYGSGFGGNRY